jgi:hypothetical protein
MKILIRLFCLLGTAIWIAVLDIAWRFRDTHKPDDFLLAACPFIYFIIIFSTSFAIRKSSLVLGAGVVGQVILAFFNVALFFKGPTAFSILLLSLFYGFMWITMYRELDNDAAA